MQLDIHLSICRQHSFLTKDSSGKELWISFYRNAYNTELILVMLVTQLHWLVLVHLTGPLPCFGIMNPFSINMMPQVVDTALLNNISYVHICFKPIYFPGIVREISKLSSLTLFPLRKYFPNLALNGKASSCLSVLACCHIRRKREITHFGRHTARAHLSFPKHQWNRRC